MIVVDRAQRVMELEKPDPIIVSIVPGRPTIFTSVLNIVKTGDQNSTDPIVGI